MLGPRIRDFLIDNTYSIEFMSIKFLCLKFCFKVLLFLQEKYFVESGKIVSEKNNLLVRKNVYNTFILEIVILSSWEITIKNYTLCISKEYNIIF